MALVETQIMDTGCLKLKSNEKGTSWGQISDTANAPRHLITWNVLECRNCNSTCPRQVSTTASFPINVPPKQQASQDALGSPLAVGTENGETQMKHWGRGHVPTKLWCGTWSKATDFRKLLDSGIFQTSKDNKQLEMTHFCRCIYHMFKHTIISFLGKTRGWQYSDIPILKEMRFEKEGIKKKTVNHYINLISQELQ